MTNKSSKKSHPDEHAKIRQAEEAMEIVRDIVIGSTFAFSTHSDIENAKRLVVRFGDRLLHVPARGWFVWSGSAWAADPSGVKALEFARRTIVTKRSENSISDLFGISPNRIERISVRPIRAVLEICHKSFQTAGSEPPAEINDLRRIAHDITRACAEIVPTASEIDELFELRNKYLRWASIEAPNLASLGRLKAMVAIAQIDTQRAANELDQDTNLLNVENGTIELKRKIVFREHRREDILTRTIPVKYDAHANAPQWEKFVQRVIPDREERAFAQRYFGSCLSGKNRDQAALIIHGRGSNKRSALVESIADVLAEYAVSLPMDLFTRPKFISPESPTPLLATLLGARLVRISHSDPQTPLNESLIKKITGSEKLTVHRKYENPFEFRPHCKLVLVSDHLPRIDGQDDGIWSRLFFLNFDQKISEAQRDPDLPHKLRKEQSGILNWLLDGFADWYVNGLQPPTSVKRTGTNYRAESDNVRDFIAARTRKVEGAKTAGSILYEQYRRWCLDTRRELKSSSDFGSSLVKLGYERRKSSSNYYHGIELLPY